MSKVYTLLCDIEITRKRRENILLKKGTKVTEISRSDTITEPITAIITFETDKGIKYFTTENKLKEIQQ